jgi:hypothetical protein
MVELDGLLSKAMEEPFVLTFRTVIHTTSDDTQALLTSPLYRFERCVESQCTHDALEGWIESNALCVNVNVNVFSLGLSNATEEQQVYSAIWDMPMLRTYASAV